MTFKIKQMRSGHDTKTHQVCNRGALENDDTSGGAALPSRKYRIIILETPHPHMESLQKFDQSEHSKVITKCLVA